MKFAMLLAFMLFLGQAAAELFPLPEDWLSKPVPVEVPVEPEVKPEPVDRPYVPMTRRWQG